MKLSCVIHKHCGWGEALWAPFGYLLPAFGWRGCAQILTHTHSKFTQDHIYISNLRHSHELCVSRSSIRIRVPLGKYGVLCGTFVCIQYRSIIYMWSKCVIFISISISKRPTAHTMILMNANLNTKCSHHMLQSHTSYMYENISKIESENIFIW